MGWHPAPYLEASRHCPNRDSESNDPKGCVEEVEVSDPLVLHQSSSNFT